MNTTTHLSIADMPKEEQTRMVNMANHYRQYKNGTAYIPLQDLPKYEAAYQRIYPKKDMTLGADDGIVNIMEYINLTRL